MRKPNGTDEIVRALEGQGQALSQLAAAFQQQKPGAFSVPSQLAPWITIAITLGGLIAGGSYFISQRPTVPVVEAIVDERQKPIAAAVQDQKAALKDVGESVKAVGEDLRKVRESQIRQETRREVEAGRPGAGKADD